LRREASGRTVLHSRGNELHYLGVGFVGGDGEPDRPLDVAPIAYASGAGALYRASALRQVGTFDAAMFMYHEDSDLGWRLRVAGRAAGGVWILRAPRELALPDGQATGRAGAAPAA